MRGRIEEYMGRAESVKKRIDEEKRLGLYHEQIIIEENSSGHSYEKVFGRFFDQEVTKIEIDDPYIRLFHQVVNYPMCTIISYMLKSYCLFNHGMMSNDCSVKISLGYANWQ